MNTKHTQGQWESVAPRPQTITTKEGKEIATVACSNPAWAANANLIAAAPELLEALLEISAITIETNDEVRAIAMTAIAKTMGEL